MILWAFWVVGDYGECDATCGTGTKVRTVECSTGNENDCKNLQEPESEALCNTEPCRKANILLSYWKHFWDDSVNREKEIL